MVEMCLSVSFRAGGGGGYDNKEPANIHLGVVILRKFCLRYESILDPPMKAAVMSSIFASFPKPAYFNNFTIIIKERPIQTSYAFILDVYFFKALLFYTKRRQNYEDFC